MSSGGVVLPSFEPPAPDLVAERIMKEMRELVQSQQSQHQLQQPIPPLEQMQQSVPSVTPMTTAQPQVQEDVQMAEGNLQKKDAEAQPASTS